MELKRLKIRKGCFARNLNGCLILTKRSFGDHDTIKYTSASVSNIPIFLMKIALYNYPYIRHSIWVEFQKEIKIDKHERNYR